MMKNIHEMRPSFLLTLLSFIILSGSVSYECVLGDGWDGMEQVNLVLVTHSRTPFLTWQKRKERECFPSPSLISLISKILFSLYNFPYHNACISLFSVW